VPTREPRVIVFDESHPAPVAERMVALAAAGDGWINLSPGLDVDLPPPPRSALAVIFGARGPMVPLATWAPAKGRNPATVGIQHGQGPRTIARLAEDGIALPEGWRRLQDHPKSGLVLATTPADDAAGLGAVLAWLLRATGALCPVPRTGEWRAYCYET
jgi:hypothetical protein